MKLTALALGLLPIVVMVGALDGSVYERAEGLSPKLEASLDGQARRAVDGLFEMHEVIARVAVPAPQAPAAPSAAATAGLPNQVDTNAACQTQLAKLNGKPSNPSGKSVCYNIAQLNNSTGDFQAQVLVYDIGLPTNQWVSLLAKGESVSLTYPGGKVQPGAQKLTLPPANGQSPTLNASLLFTGQLNSTMMGQLNNVTAMRMALTPQVTLSAETADGQFVNTTASNGEASFINGLYSSQAFTISQAQAAAASGTPFVLPGTTLGIFPTGFIITAIWTVFFSIAVGFGTFGRYQFRMAYRNRNTGPVYRPAAAAVGVAAYEKR